MSSPTIFLFKESAIFHINFIITLSSLTKNCWILDGTEFYLLLSIFLMSWHNYKIYFESVNIVYASCI